MNNEHEPELLTLRGRKIYGIFKHANTFRCILSDFGSSPKLTKAQAIELINMLTHTYQLKPEDSANG